MIIVVYGIAAPQGPPRNSSGPKSGRDPVESSKKVRPWRQMT